MTVEEHVDRFIKFLKDKQALSHFNKALLCLRSEKDPREFVKACIEEGKESKLISRAFLWHATPQSFQYWRDLQKEWRGFLFSPTGIKTKFLVLFLEKKGAKERFIDNLEEEGRYSLDFLEKDHPFHTAIMSAFTWVHTPEGVKYWEDLDDEWREMVDSREIFTLDREKGMGELYDFLVSSNTLTPFLSNLEEDKVFWKEGMTLSERLEELKKVGTGSKLAKAFSWEYTPEGFRFWDSINVRFVNRLRSLAEVKKAAKKGVGALSNIGKEDLEKPCDKNTTPPEESSIDDLASGQGYKDITMYLIKKASFQLRNIRENAQESYTSFVGSGNVNYRYMTEYMTEVSKTVADLLDLVLSRMEQRDIK